MTRSWTGACVIHVVARIVVYLAEHLVVQILLLTEKEVTAVISMNQQIASKVGLSEMENSEQIEQLSQSTSIDEVAQNIQRSLSEDVK